MRWLNQLFEAWGDAYVAANVIAITWVVALTAATVYGYAA